MAASLVLAAIPNKAGSSFPLASLKPGKLHWTQSGLGEEGV